MDRRCFQVEVTNRPQATTVLRRRNETRSFSSQCRISFPQEMGSKLGPELVHLQVLLHHSSRRIDPSPQFQEAPEALLTIDWKLIKHSSKRAIKPSFKSATRGQDLRTTNLTNLPTSSQSPCIVRGVSDPLR